MNAEPAGETFGMTQTLPKFVGLTRTEWLIGVSALLVVRLLVHPYRAQQASRYALTAAVVERGTVVLDDYAPVLGRDRAIRDGHVYSDKAPGQPFLAVPVHAIGRLVGVEDATTLRIAMAISVCGGSRFGPPRQTGRSLAALRWIEPARSGQSPMTSS